MTSGWDIYRIERNKFNYPHPATKTGIFDEIEVTDSTKKKLPLDEPFPEDIRKILIHITSNDCIKLPENLEVLVVRGDLCELTKELPKGLKTLNIESSHLKPTEIILNDGLEGFGCNNNNWHTLPKLPKSLILISCKRGNDIKQFPILPYNMRFIMEEYNAQEIKLDQYNKAANVAGLPEKTLATVPTEDEYYQVTAINAKDEFSRASDLSLVFLDAGLPPYVTAEIISWDRNRNTDGPVLSAFDVAQLGGFVDSLQVSRNWTKGKPKLFKLSSKNQKPKKYM